MEAKPHGKGHSTGGIENDVRLQTKMYSINKLHPQTDHQKLCKMECKSQQEIRNDIEIKKPSTISTMRRWNNCLHLVEAKCYCKWFRRQAEVLRPREREVAIVALEVMHELVGSSNWEEKGEKLNVETTKYLQDHELTDDRKIQMGAEKLRKLERKEIKAWKTSQSLMKWWKVEVSQEILFKQSLESADDEVTMCPGKSHQDLVKQNKTIFHTEAGWRVGLQYRVVEL